MADTSDEAMAKATGRTSQQWRQLLDARGAAAWSHADIAAMLGDTEGLPQWWAQTVTVAYERLIGRRVVGQTCAGDFQTQASKTLPGTIDHWIGRWQARYDGLDTLDGVPLDGPPRATSSQNWRYWKADLADGSRVSLTVGAKGSDKALLGVGHQKLSGPEDVARWKAFWQAELADLA